MRLIMIIYMTLHFQVISTYPQIFFLCLMHDHEMNVVQGRRWIGSQRTALNFAVAMPVSRGTRG